MTKRMLIDASHAEETRVVVLDGNRLEDFDVETQSRRQLKGNIYLAKVVRVEPSLQAAFVEYGGNRHGFLAFGEIHPDYYQIPVADRQRLLQLQEEEARADEEADDDDASSTTAASLQRVEVGSGTTAQNVQTVEEVGGTTEFAPDEALIGADLSPESVEPPDLGADRKETARGAHLDHEPEVPDLATEVAAQSDAAPGTRVRQIAADTHMPATVAGEAEQADEGRNFRSSSRFVRTYKIQEVIRRRQILLIQVVKEERGTKGAALTTYISLAGRYCVLMPNSPRGGGISRKITSAADRRRLKEVTAELDIPRGMGLIIRTAGAMRPKAEITRDGEYLLRLWDDIREQTMQSTAPALIYEEASLIKRAIRDVYSRDVDELLIDGEDGWRAAREFMRMLMPTHVKKVQLWPQGGQPLFAHQQVESMLDSMLNPTVQLRSGGYLVINQTEALVAVDVNSGRSTRERGIEETALRTNLEAADEAARQLRLRDLAGLIVIDFIDMESKKHNAMVERRMAEALRSDRARIQVGHISHFGLMELSRQRLLPSLAETSLTICEYCAGTGHVRSTESAALHVLREIEEEGGRQRNAEILVHVAGATALYILNHKRHRLGEIEQRYRMQVSFAADETLHAAQTRIDRVRIQSVVEEPQVPVSIATRALPERSPVAPSTPTIPGNNGAEPAPEPAVDFGARTDPDALPGETAEEGEQRRKRRRRRRRGGRRDEAPVQETAPLPLDAEQPEIVAHQANAEPAEYQPAAIGEAEAAADAEAGPQAIAVPGHDEATEAEQASAKRGRRGGRRRRKPSSETEGQPGPAPYVGPTPADPFAVTGLDMFEALEGLTTRPLEPVSASPPQTVAEPEPEHVLGMASEGHNQPDTKPSTSTPSSVDLPANSAEPLNEALESSSASGPPADAVPDEQTPLPSALQPILVGEIEPTQEKRRGWWRR